MDLGPGSIFMQEAGVMHAYLDTDLSQGCQPGNRRFSDSFTCADVYALAIDASAMSDAVSNQSRGEIHISRSNTVLKP